MGVLAEYFKTTERTVFWDDDVKANVDPFEGMESGFFAADWGFKVRIIKFAPCSTAFMIDFVF
jgi:hypothetical protein